MAVLRGKRDPYGGILVDSSSLPPAPSDFGRVLAASLSQWHTEGIRGVWLSLPLPSNASLLEVAVKHGFKAHHATPRHITLSAWLPENQPNTLPGPACHYAGVGVAVVDAEDRILVVQELNGPLKGRGYWKVPTGMVEANEGLSEAARREVREETGVECEIQGMVCLRETHSLHVQRLTDLFFLFKARPLTTDLTPQDSEILQAKWMPLQEYLSLPQWRPGSAPSHLNTLMVNHLEDPQKGGLFLPVALPRGGNRGDAVVYGRGRAKL